MGGDGCQRRAAYGAGEVAYKNEKIQPGQWTTVPILGDVDESVASIDWHNEMIEKQLDDEADVQDEGNDEDLGGVEKPLKLSSVVR
ncbi:hypothetical protein HPP92_006339 [Vanilla planifolia]|uniref:Uncharacterized protein n=1 Tax=Vanilla planifolia TaxID=51239 RepID=A0A835VAU9_VANPL|nr:hypothetical protein HPP92_006339 [Vanilla planifolia]